MVQKLADIFRTMDEGVGRTLSNCQLIGLWAEVIDERVRKNTEPIKIRNRTLYVSTSSSTWAQELSFFKRELIQKFNAKAGREAIRDIRFKSDLIGVK